MIHKPLLRLAAALFACAAPQLACVEAAAQERKPQLQEIELANFSKSTAGWRLSLGSEFPGAKGSFAPEAAKDAPGGGAAKLSADFSAGGRYVMASIDFKEPVDITELRLHLKTALPVIGLRMVDSQGQTFQREIPSGQPAASWRIATAQLSDFSNPSIKGIYHWGGPNDGVWRGPAKNLAIMLNASKAGSQLEAQIARITAMALPPPPKLEPEDVPLAFYVEPGKTSKLSWKLSGAQPEPDELVYEILDYQRKPAGSGSATLGSDGRVSVEAVFQRGYFEVSFTKLGRQSFGVISLTPQSFPKDPFFCVDGAFGYFKPGKIKELRCSYLDVLARSGITMQRERLPLTLKQLGEGKFAWPENAKLFRAEAAERGIKILENFCPSEQRRPNPYPENLAGFAESWRAFVKEAGPACGSAEIWNEPDIFAGGLIPGDSYVALMRAARYVNETEGISWPLGGGVFNHIPKAVFETYAISGFLDVAGTFIYHDYYGSRLNESERTERLVSSYRKWCEQYGRPAMPFWMGESGCGWTRGPGRPPVNEDSECARMTALKAAECKAMGNARHFPFLLIYFDEGKVNWGLHAIDHTPLRSMAAYVNSIKALSGASYIGDLKVGGLLHARTFARAGGTEAVTVLCAAKQGSPASAKLPVAPLRAEGADGRRLKLAADGSLPLPDGVAYVYFKKAGNESAIDREAPAMAVFKQASGMDAKSGAWKPSPLVVMPDLGNPKLGASSKGYVAREPGSCEVAAKLYNLSATEQRYSFSVNTPPGAVLKSTEKLEGSIPANSLVPLKFTLDLTKAFAGAGRQFDFALKEPGNAVPAWGFRLLKIEQGKADRISGSEQPLTPDAMPDSSWRELGADDYVPLGFVIYDGTTKAWAKCSWEPRALVFNILVDKKGFHQKHDGETMWMGDSVQIAVRTDGSMSPKPQSPYVELTGALTQGGPKVYRHQKLSDAKAKGLAAPSMIKVSQSASRTLYTIRAPVEEIGLQELKAGMRLRIALLVNYNDGVSRAGYFHWGDGIAGNKDIEEYCELLLGE